MMLSSTVVKEHHSCKTHTSGSRKTPLLSLAIIAKLVAASLIPPLPHPPFFTSGEDLSHTHTASRGPKFGMGEGRVKKQHLFGLYEIIQWQ